MFRFENKTPYYLNNNSRDFQLMNRLMDSVFMGQRGDIHTILNLNSPHKCKNSILDLLAKKVGFFTDKYIDDNVLRYIISSFQIAVKNKGTEYGIMQAVTAILKAENSVEKPQITINRQDLQQSSNSYQVQIFTPIQIINKIALEEFLKYVIPIGWTYTIQSYQKAEKPHQTVIAGIDKVTYIQTVDTIPSIIRSAVEEFDISGKSIAELENELSELSPTDTEQINELRAEIQRKKYLNSILETANTTLGSIDTGIISDIHSFNKIINTTINNANDNLESILDLSYVRTNSNNQVIIDSTTHTPIIDNITDNQLTSNLEEVQKDE